MLTGIKKHQITIPAQSLLQEVMEGAWSISMSNCPRFEGDPQPALTTEIALDSQGYIEIFSASRVPSSDGLQRAAAKSAEGSGYVVDQVPFTQPDLERLDRE